jgi:acyl-ACP thioesterase
MERPLYGKYEYNVSSYLADLKKQASLPGLFLLLQESAWRHAEEGGFGWKSLYAKDCFWVLSAIKAEIFEYPAWNDTVLVETWSREPGNFTACRHFDMFAADGTRLLSAASVWLILNKKKRPQKIAELITGFPLSDRIAIEFDSRKLPKLSATHSPDSRSVKTATYSDADINGHVNNTCYLQWVIDAFPTDYLMTRDICRIEINYLKESLPGRQYFTAIEERSPDEYLCAVAGYPDCEELAKMNLKFKKTIHHQ